MYSLYDIFKVFLILIFKTVGRARPAIHTHLSNFEISFFILRTHLEIEKR